MSSSTTTPVPSASLAPPPPSTFGKKGSARAAKGKSTNILVLRISPEQLRKFTPDFVAGDLSVASRSAASSPPSEDAKPGSGPFQEQKDSVLGDAKPEETNSHATTPNPPEANGDTASTNPSTNGLKRKASNGEQRETSAKPNGIDAEGKPKAKAGPKRRKLDADGKGMWTAPPHLSHRLGPKANQGDINARLRALDRSGKPCSKWQRKGIQLASFTGVKWGVGIGAWKTTKLPEGSVDADGQSETTGSSEPKREPPSSNVASEKSNAGGADGTNNAPTVSADAATPAAAANGTPLPSSPAPVASASA